MHRLLARSGVFGLALLTLPPVAVAQQVDSSRGYVAVNGGLQVLPSEFTDRASFAGPRPVYTEMVSGAATGEASGFNGAYSIESGPVVDVSGGARLWRNLGGAAMIHSPSAPRGALSAATTGSGVQLRPDPARAVRSKTTGFASWRTQSSCSTN